jgi:hypothetical protein
MRNPQFQQVKFQLPTYQEGDYKLLKLLAAAGRLLAAALLRLLKVLLLANACETPPGSKTAWP